MNEQEKTKLMEYMKAAIDLETEKSTQESIIKAYNENSLARKPELNLEEEPSQPERPPYVEYHVDWKNPNDLTILWFFMGITSCIFGLFLLPIGLGIWTVVSILSFLLGGFGIYPY